MIMILCILPKQLVGSFLDRHCQLGHICRPKNKTGKKLILSNTLKSLSESQFSIV